MILPELGAAVAGLCAKLAGTSRRTAGSEVELFVGAAATCVTTGATTAASAGTCEAWRREDDCDAFVATDVVDDTIRSSRAATGAETSFTSVESVAESSVAAAAAGATF